MSLSDETRVVQPKRMKFTEAINDATDFILRKWDESFVIGLGVSYPGGADGTMGDLAAEFPTRVIDTPVSEAAITGAAVGSAICGSRPIVHHGRVEFSLFGVDQIVTQASNWNFMFGGGNPVPIVFRIAVGRQWGNGPQHTQPLYSLFASVPGLKVVVPSEPLMAWSLLVAATADKNPVVYMEPRWLYQTSGTVDRHWRTDDLASARTVIHGTDVTVVTFGDGVMEGIRAASALKEHGISIEVIDLVSLHPIDVGTVRSSVSRTRRLLTFESSPMPFSVGSQIINVVAQDEAVSLVALPRSISAPDVPVPTAPSLTESYYPTFCDLMRVIGDMMGRQVTTPHLSFDELHLAPRYEFA